MSARGGRGGGRGGRGGISKSFNRDQLNAMGVTSNEILPTLVTQPPPLYPLMDRKPVPLATSVETDYLLILKQDMVDHMQLSPFYLKMPIDRNKQPEQEIDKLVAQLPSVKEKYDWKMFPTELRPKMLARRSLPNTGTIKVIRNIADVEQRLIQLEQIEEKSVVKEEKDDTENPATQDDDEVMEEEVDEEMDDGTDYANNYFDNGEEYEEEDDNLDDGPIY